MDGNEKRARAEPTEQAIADSFRAHYPRFQYALVHFLAEHLADAARVFGGDLHQVLVLAVLGQRQLHWMAETERVAGADPGWARKMTASRIADVTGVPRETVRRKLARLEARGWVERSADGAFLLVMRDGVSVARAELSELNQRNIERAARLMAALRGLL